MFIGRAYIRIGAGNRVYIVGHLLDEMGINSRGKWRHKVATYCVDDECQQQPG